MKKLKEKEYWIDLDKVKTFEDYMFICKKLDFTIIFYSLPDDHRVTDLKLYLYFKEDDK